MPSRDEVLKYISRRLGIPVSEIKEEVAADEQLTVACSMKFQRALLINKPKAFTIKDLVEKLTK